MENTFSYNPFPYQPKLQAFYLGRPLPQEVAAKAAGQPEIAQHLQSIWQFSTWLNQHFPAMAAAIMGNQPKLLNPVAVVESGSLAPSTRAAQSSKGAPVGSKLRGLGNVGDITFEYDPAKDYGVPSGSTSIVSNPASQSSAVTEWGKTVSDLLGKYLIYDQQKRLINLNIARAEKGLPPIDASSYGAGVSIGVSPGVQQLAYIAIGGLVIVGLLNSLKRK